MPATISGAHLGIDTHANRPAANAAGQPIGALYSCSTHGLIYKTDGSTWSTYATLGSGTSITTSEAFLTGDVTMTNADQYYDGPSLSLAAGTYNLFAHASLSISANNFGEARLWDGTNVWDEAECYVETTGGRRQLIVEAAGVVLGSTTTVKISCAAHVAGGTIKATNAFNGTTNKASKIMAVKIA